MADESVEGPAPDSVSYRADYVGSRKSVKAGIEMLTPEQAQKLLDEANRNNRPLSDVFAGRYASEMKAGRWRMNGQGIVFADDGTLLDGQHRLRAIVLAGIPVPMLIVRGVSADTFTTIDQGRKRSFAQFLGINGEKSPTTLASAVHWVRVIESGGQTTTGGIHHASVADMYVILAGMPAIRDSVSYVKPLAKKGVFEPGPFSALHYLAFSLHPGERHVDRFFEELFTGEGLDRESSVYWLRELLYRPGPRRLTPLYKMAVSIKALNATLTGRFVKTLKWLDSEDFPVIFSSRRAAA